MLLTEYDEEKTLKAEFYAGMRQATIEYVTNMYANNVPPERIATLLNLDLDKVTTILTEQGLLQS